MNNDSEGFKEARRKRDIWYRDLMTAKKIVFIKSPNSKRIIDQEIKLIFIENIEFNI